jgi:two-component system response regulator YesN
MVELYSLFVVDDEEEIRRGIVDSIDWNDMGFQVVGEASDGADAIHKIETLLPDVVLSDIRMPGLDGIALMSYIREHFPQIKVVVLSGYNDFDYLTASIKNEVAGYLLKPTDLELFRETFLRLRKNLDKRRECQRERSRLEEMAKESPSYLREKLNAQDRYKTANEKLAERIIEYVDEEYTSRELSLKSISGHLQKSPAYISKVFKEVTGDNYVHYVSRKRLAKAMDLLQNTSLLVYQVTEAVGWSDQSSFIRLFKKQYGFTPSEIMKLKVLGNNENSHR